MRAVLRRAAFLVTVATGAGVLAAGMVVATAGPAAASAVLYAYAGGTASSPASCPQDTNSPPDPTTECSLSDALTLANAGDTINLATPGSTNHYVGNWGVGTSSPPVTIQAAAGLSDQPVLDGNGGSPTGCSTTSCNGPVLTVGSGEFAALSGITITGGNNTQTTDSGAISNTGTVTLTDSTVSGNTAAGTGDFPGEGGGIFNLQGSVTLTDSTVSGNTTVAGGGFPGEGGGIYNDSGSVTLTDSTVAGNASDNGGGIDNFGGTVTLTGSTISGNSATGDANARGGGINSVGGTVTAGGTIVAANKSPNNPNCDAAGSATMNSAGYNLTNDTLTGNATATDCGFTPKPAGTDVVGADPLLGPLADNGGPTQTMMPGTNSPAIGMIPDPTAGLCPATDQRGLNSAAGTKCDAGAVQTSNAFVLYAAVAATGAGSCLDAADACTLDTALGQVAPGGTINLTTPGDDTAASRYVGNWTINTNGTSASAPVTIEAVAGLSSPPVLDGNGPNAPSGETCSTTSCAGPVLTVPSGEYVDLSGLTIANGNNTTTFPGAGGGLDNAGTVTITGSAFTGNTARGGGAIASGINFGSGGTGSVTVTDSTFTGNSAGVGGAIDNGTGHGPGTSGGFGTVSVTDSTFTGNSAGDGGAIVNGNEDGGGTVTVTGSTFTGNSAHNGGAINSAQDSSQNNGGGTVTVTDSTFSGNTASLNGGAIDNSDGQGGNGTVQVTASTFSGNSATTDGGAINNQMGTFRVAGDVFDGSCAAHGIWKDGGYNAGSDRSCFLGGTGDVNAGSSSALKLGPLADNGGPTQTIMPLAGSPVIAAIPASTTVTLGGGQVQLCPRTDQRGVKSADGANCTIGAVEVPTITITVTVSGSQVFGGSPAFTETNNAPNNAQVDDSKLSCTTAGGTALGSLSAGTYTLDGANCSGVTATGPDNYQISYAGKTGGFTVTPAPQAITFTSTVPSNAVVGGPSYKVTATGGGSGNLVTFSVPSSAASVCSLGGDGFTVSFTHPGTCVIDADQAGNANYAAAPTVQQSFTVGKATPVITWANPADITWGTPLSGTQLDATASVPGTFTYTPKAGTVLGPGTGQQLSVSFTPTDTTDYTNASATATINVVFKPATCITKSFSGPLVIGAGQAYCVAKGATITSGVTIKAGGALYLTGGTIKGSLSATGAAAITLCGATVSGGVTITGSTGPLAIGTCGKNTIGGSVSLTNNTGGLIYQNNVVSGSLTITGNTGGTVTTPGNKTTGTVTIKNNS